MQSLTEEPQSKERDHGIRRVENKKGWTIHSESSATSGIRHSCADHMSVLVVNLSDPS